MPYRHDLYTGAGFVLVMADSDKIAKSCVWVEIPADEKEEEVGMQISRPIYHYIYADLNPKWAEPIAIKY